MLSIWTALKICHLGKENMKIFFFQYKIMKDAPKFWAAYIQNQIARIVQYDLGFTLIYSARYFKQQTFRNHHFLD